MKERREEEKIPEAVNLRAKNRRQGEDVNGSEKGNKPARISR